MYDLSYVKKRRRKKIAALVLSLALCLSLINPEDDTVILELKVNGKYDDLVVLYVDGTYIYVSTSGDEVILAEVNPSDS